MDPRDSNLFRSCNVKCVESKNFDDVKKDLEGLPPITELQPWGPSVQLDHLYNVSSCISNHRSGASLSDCVPNTFSEAMNSPFLEEWKKAIIDEINLLLENEVWEEVFELNEITEQPITTWWIFTIKFDGVKEFAKAQLVARGFQDKNMYDLRDIYAPVINGSVLRWLISFLVKHGMVLFALVCFSLR